MRGHARELPANIRDSFGRGRLTVRNRITVGAGLFQAPFVNARPRAEAEIPAASACAQCRERCNPEVSAELPRRVNQGRHTRVDRVRICTSITAQCDGCFERLELLHPASNGRAWSPSRNWPRLECTGKLCGGPYPAKAPEKGVPFSSLPVTCSEVKNDAATSGVPQTLPLSCAGF